MALSFFVNHHSLQCAGRYRLAFSTSTRHIRQLAAILSFCDNKMGNVPGFSEAAHENGQTP
jgi:hypothetical protein